MRTFMIISHNNKHQQLGAAVIAAASTNATNSLPPPPIPPRVLKCIANGEYSQACDILEPLPRSMWTRNTLGVCAMRCGRLGQAVDVFRGLLLISGTTVIRLDAEDLLRVNFATALLLRGLTSGALEALSDVKDPTNAAAARVKDAIRQWSKSLPLLRRLDWRINGCAPANCCVTIDFEPGEFHFVVETTQTTFVEPSQAAMQKLAV